MPSMPKSGVGHDLYFRFDAIWLCVVEEAPPDLFSAALMLTCHAPFPDCGSSRKE